MKRVFILIPMMLPKISDRAAAELLEILEQLLACVRHHYEPQIRRLQRRQRHAQPPHVGSRLQLFDDEPF